MGERCPWCGTDPLYVAYHDREWGVPLHDERALFELLTLEGAQAGLSWLTILRKREGYRAAFAGFDPAAVARLTDADAAALLGDASIVRNRAKIASTIGNARALLKLRESGTLDQYVWSFVDGRPIQGRRRTMADVPPRTEVSDRMSKDLKRRGFKFVGSTICYALMQAAGLVNDHLVTCPRHDALAGD